MPFSKTQPSTFIVPKAVKHVKFNSKAFESLNKAEDFSPEMLSKLVISGPENDNTDF